MFGIGYENMIPGAREVALKVFIEHPAVLPGCEILSGRKDLPQRIKFR